VLLEAIGRLEQAVVAERSAQDLDRLRFDLMEMAKAISRTKSEIAAIRPADQPSHLIAASETLDAISRTTERATSEILEAAEHIQEAAWTLREDGANAALCDELDRRATEIYTACSFQDLTAQRIARIVQTLRYLEGRINAMIDIWGAAAMPEAPPPSAPAPDLALVPDPRPELTQNDVDIVIVDHELFGGFDAVEEPAQPPALPALPDADDLTFVEGPAEGPSPELSWAESEPAESGESEEPPTPEVPPLRLEAFAAIDALGTREKLERFT
jgi:chemotaxis regulatin CheY-phosphate phosphatase CheZ